MKTDEWITLLAAGGATVTAPPPLTHFARALGLGAAGATALLLLMLPVRADLLQAVLVPMFWLKVGFVVTLAAAGLFTATRLSRPGADLRLAPAAIALPIAVIWGVAAWALIDADPLERPQLFYGTTYKSCPLLIAVLSVPVFAAVLHAMRDLAPTRPRLAGAVAGLLSGAVAAVVYCLHCPEMAAPFIAFWYLLGILIPASLGALLGNRLLRW